MQFETPIVLLKLLTRATNTYKNLADHSEMMVWLVPQKSPFLFQKYLQKYIQADWLICAEGF
ncbi:hypothetical protein BSPWISOXPB_2624 [uncultured Gammaproteobacteria bacterium]|nr:hypothetical protein BSPWISOXPB_2624 [uncultured Gammaproteobacteria bacterium]